MFAQLGPQAGYQGSQLLGGFVQVFDGQGQPFARVACSALSNISWVTLPLPSIAWRQSNQLEGAIAALHQGDLADRVREADAAVRLVQPVERAGAHLQVAVLDRGHDTVPAIVKQAPQQLQAVAQAGKSVPSGQRLGQAGSR